MRYGECITHENTHHAKPGDTIKLGTCLGSAVEPYMRWARLVGILHGGAGFKRFIVRTFKEDDGYFPTGEYRTTSLMFLTPHELRDV